VIISTAKSDLDSQPQQDEAEGCAVFCQQLSAEAAQFYASLSMHLLKPISPDAFA